VDKFAAALVSAVVVASTITPGVAQDDDNDKPELMPGRYNLRLLMPTQAEEENKDVTLPADVKIDKAELTIDTKGLLGNPIMLRGLASKSEVKFGMTEVEKTTLISFHFVGAATSDARAEGTFTVFADGEKVGDGKWMLTKERPDETRR
jgi:hypothetical protein